jgi:hypothetical protein
MRPAEREERDVLTVDIDLEFTNYARDWVRHGACLSYDCRLDRSQFHCHEQGTNNRIVGAAKYIYIYIFMYLYIHISYTFNPRHIEYINSVRLLGHHTCVCYVGRTPYYLNGHDSDKVAYKHFGQDDSSRYKLSSLSLAQEGLGLTVSAAQGFPK